MKAIPNILFFEEVERCLTAGEHVTIWVRGESMRPFLRSGRDRVEIAPATDEELMPGRVVLFRYGPVWLLHRIVARCDDRLTLQGDGNYRTTFERATVADVVGVVTRVIRSSGRTMEADSASWRRYWCLWRMANPLRRWLVALDRRLFRTRSAEK